MLMIFGSDKEILIKTAEEAFKLYMYEPLLMQVKKTGSLDNTAETLKSDRFDAGYIYVIQSVLAWCDGSGTPQIFIGITNSGNRYPFKIATIANAEDSVEYVGQLIVHETHQIYVTFEGATTGDTAYLNINGYRIKR